METLISKMLSGKNTAFYFVILLCRANVMSG